MTRTHRSHDYNSRLPLPPADIQELHDFCQPNTSRYDALVKSLNRRNIPHDTLPLDGCRHVVLPLASSRELDRTCYRVTLVAHYDRVPGTPGANDNAAAVFQLLAHREDIQKRGWQHRTQIIFTDREEVTDQMNVRQQGSCILAQHLTRLGVSNVLFLVLDMCGIGTTPIWGQSPEKLQRSFPGSMAARNAYTQMAGFLKHFTGGENFGINTLFSDDLGLLVGGYPALQLSMLPGSEARSWKRSLADRPESPQLPPSWKAMHSPNDTPETLDAGSFRTISRILLKLSRNRFPLD